MVLQREKPCRVWGTAASGEEIKLVFGTESFSVQADSDGSWEVILPPLQATESADMVISGENSRICLKDVAVGEVWVAGGQSNMEFYMRYEKHIEEEKAVCINPRIRIFDIPEVSYAGQAEDFDYSEMGFWRKADKENLEYFSAAAYYFAKELESRLQVPIGIIGCNWGGTSASVWMSQESAKEYAKPWVQAFEKKFHAVDMNEYWKKQKENFLNDRGRPFEDAFSELILPRTLPPDEVNRFFAEMDPKDAEKLQMPQPQIMPGCLYEHMVKSAAPYTVRGILWYQGETDDEIEGDCQKYYGQMLKAVIKDWRDIWKEPELPFMIVQLPGWEDWIGAHGKAFPIIRKCQQDVAEADPAAWLCSISDAGERHDIHPKDKKVVGYRLALLAMGHIYGKEILCDPPQASEIRRSGNELCIRFNHAEGGLHVDGEKIEGLTVKVNGESISFEEKLQEEYLLLKLPEQFRENMVKVEFAQTQWFKVNLYNQGKLPAVPFSFEC